MEKIEGGTGPIEGCLVGKGVAAREELEFQRDVVWALAGDQDALEGARKGERETSKEGVEHLGGGLADGDDAEVADGAERNKLRDARVAGEGKVADAVEFRSGELAGEGGFDG